MNFTSKEEKSNKLKYSIFIIILLLISIIISISIVSYNKSSITSRSIFSKNASLENYYASTSTELIQYAYNNIIKIKLKGIDENYASNSLTKDNIVVKVGGVAVTPEVKELSTSTTIDNGIQYILTLEGFSKVGELTLEIAANTLTDKAANKNILNTLSTGIEIVDRISPTVSVSAPTTWTNSNVTITGKATDTVSGISYYQFSTDDSLTSSSSGWTSITNTTSQTTQTYSASSNGTYYFYAKDASGNVSKSAVTVSCIDKTLPVISVSASTTSWTNSNITLTGKATDLNSGISYYQFSTSDSLTASSSGWTSITNTTSEISKTYTASSNNTYYFYVKDAAGNVVKKSIVVSTIDKTAPTISSKSVTAVSDSYFKLTVKASDTGGSGLSRVYISSTNDTRDVAMTSSSVDISNILPSTTYTIYVKDAAGNTSSTTTVTTTALNYNVNNTYWTETLAQAISKASSGNTITLLKSLTDTSSGTISKNVTLNLNSKTLTRSAVITINSGVTATIKSGTLKFTGASVRAIQNNGTATLSSLTVNATANRVGVGNAVVDNFGTMTISGGSYISSGNTVANNSSLTVTSATITSTGTTYAADVALWNVSGTTTVKSSTIKGSSSSAILNRGSTDYSVDTSRRVEITSTTVDGFILNCGVFKIFDGTKITFSLNGQVGVENHGNMSIEGSSTTLTGNTSRGYFSNYGTVWHYGGTIRNNGGSTTVYNQTGGTWVRGGGTIIGGTNV